MATGFFISETIRAKADRRMCNHTTRNLFRGFCFSTSSLVLEEGEELAFRVGEVALPAIPDGSEYALRVTENGVAITGRDFSSLMRGYMHLLMQIEWTPEDKRLMIRPIEAASAFRLRQNRMIHFCVFPETSMTDLKKFVRLSGVLQYTHIVLEFWGMLRYDCCHALAWPSAFSKDEIREVIREIRELGMEPIPMFNSLGHATACRLASGKHVALDQDPSLYHLFTPDGWGWNIDSDEVKALLRAVRKELYELFGEGTYFHAGLDESYIHNRTPELYAKLPTYLKELTEEISREGRRPMIWMDMFLPPEAYANVRPHACTNKSPEECDRILSSLSHDTVLVDWQYDNKEAPISTTLYLRGRGFDLMGAPWFLPENCHAHIDTAVEHELFGVMQTTWHTCARELPKMLPFARHCGAAKAPWSEGSGCREEMATLLRKVMWEPYGYEDAGWMKKQITLGAEKEA